MKVIIVSPNEADNVLASGFLEGEGVEPVRCATLGEAARLVGPGYGCVVLFEEALIEPDMQAFQDAVHAQPPWSDLPLLLIAAQDSSLSSLVESAFPRAGNVTLLQRPLHPVSLVSAVAMALRARQRQYQVRDLLEERTRAINQRDEFLAMLAHELRNPLAPIRNAVYLMKTISVPDPMFAKYRDMIDKQARHITRLVDDLLDVSRMELGKVQLRRQAFDLNQAAAAAAETCLPLTSARRHTVNLHLSAEPLQVIADPVRIEQVLGNLIVNAAKFTPDGGAIDIASASEGSSALVRVCDNGSGIRADILGSVFELFVQDDSSLERTHGGLGIGLTLVKRLVELHGGSVCALSEGAGKGSCFEIRIPLAVPEARGSGTDVEPERQHQRKRVLVVEDAADLRESLGMLLEKWHHFVRYATDGREGVAVATQMRPDVAIIDIGLPGVDGYEVARRIRGGPQPWARHVKLLALTGYGHANDREMALESGFDEHLLKPVEPDVLEQLLLD
jgi:signal transduction histidine kinase/CheY-like chemotaxis protein